MGARSNIEEGTELWPEGFSAWLRVGILCTKTTQHIATLMRPFEMTVAQFDALAHLYVEDGLSQQELAERLLVSKGNVTGLINRLADRGFVERHGDPDDRRTKRLKITPAGRKLAKKTLLQQAKLVKKMMSRLEPEERDALSEHLGRLIAHFD